MPKQEFVDAVVAAALANGIPPAALAAVVEIESDWKALEEDGSTPRLLFERHVFHRELSGRAPDKVQAAERAGLARKTWSRSTQYKDQGSSKGRLAVVARAREIDVECANRSCSWGLGQTMGFLAEELGFTSATQMLDKMTAGGVAAQVDMMVGEIRRKRLVDELQRGDWAGFARIYNGPKYAENQYDTRLATACRRWEAALGGGAVGDPDLTKVQRDLMALGYNIGPAGADGVLGRRTREAVLKFQEWKGLLADGKPGPETKRALREAVLAKDFVPATPAVDQAQPVPEATPVVPVATAPSSAQVSVTKEVIEFVQRRLRELNYMHVGNVDGEFGSWSENAILAFRNDNGLPLVTTVDSQLLVALAGAKPKPIAETRANATPAQVAAKIPAVAAARAASLWAKVQAFGALILAAITGMLQWAGEGITDPPQISASAFNRTAVRLAVHGRRLEETREIAAVLAPKIDEAGDASLTLLISETIKTLVFEMLGNAGELAADGDTAEMLMFTSRALKHAEEAKKISTDQRRKIEEDFKAQTDKAVEKVVKARGGTAEDIAALREAIGIQIAKKG